MPREDEERERGVGQEPEPQATIQYAVKGANPGFVEIPSSSSSGGSTTAAPKWDWRMVYYWTKGYTQTLPNQYGNDVPYGRGINLMKGKPFPPGYRVPNGQPGGGYPASGAVATGNEVIKIQPPPQGVGAIKFWTTAQIWIKNSDSSRTGSFVCGLGVSDVNGPNFPMDPYHGVGHYLEMGDSPAVTVRAGDTVAFSLSRLDIVDNDFHAVPNWPNWQMLVSTSGNKLWPSVSPLFQNRGPTELVAVGFWAVSFATL